jgi:hypothetical protein
VAFNLWCAVLLIAVAAWLLWELWNAVAPKPITDDFLKLLDDSFGRDWRKPRTWPWTRTVWAYGFTTARRHFGARLRPADLLRALLIQTSRSRRRFVWARPRASGWLNSRRLSPFRLTR